MQEKSESLYHKILIFIFLSAVFFLQRLDTFNYVFADGYLKLIDPDSYYHLRRIFYTYNNYPKMLNFDNFLSFPSGDYVPWPPLFDFVSATITKMLGNPFFVLPSLDMVYFFIAFSIIYVFSSKEFGRISASITGFFLAIAGILRIYTSFGRVDHHALELLLITTNYLSFLAYYRKKSVPFMLLFTVTIITAFFNWPGSVIYYPPLFLFICYKLLKKEATKELFKGLFVAFHITAILIAIYLRLTKTADYPPYSYKFLSGFQRDFCFFVSIIFFNIYLTQMKKIKPVIIWSFAAVILFGGFYKFIFEVIKGIGFVGKTQPILVLIEESSPLFFSKFYSFGEELKRANSLFTPLFFLFPVAFYAYFKKRGMDAIFFFSLYFLIFTFFQLRFGYFFMLGYAVMLGVIMESLLSHFRKSLIFLSMALISILLFYSNYKEVHNRFESDAIYEGLRFLKEKTPQKEDFDNGRPPYGVLASWHLGHYIIELGKRPAIAHNFIGVSLNNDERSFIQTLFSGNEREVVEIMEKKCARFLFLDDPKSMIITDWAAISGGAPNPYIKDGRILNNNVLELFIYRLYNYNGITPPFDKSPKHLRLIYEKDEVKIFERVKGFKISAKAGDVLKAKIVTPTKSFFYVNQGKPDKAGKKFIIPYSLDAPYPVKAKEIYLENNGKRTLLNVTEEMVQ